MGSRWTHLLDVLVPVVVDVLVVAHVAVDVLVLVLVNVLVDVVVVGCFTCVSVVNALVNNPGLGVR